jgi:hypothetical protein
MPSLISYNQFESMGVQHLDNKKELVRNTRIHESLHNLPMNQENQKHATNDRRPELQARNLDDCGILSFFCALLHCLNSNDCVAEALHDSNTSMVLQITLELIMKHVASN